MSDTPTTPEEYATQEEAKRQALIEQDNAMHDETDEPSPFPAGGQPDKDDVKKSRKKS